MKILILNIFCFIAIFPFLLCAEDEVKIYNTDTRSDTVDLGMTLAGRPVTTKFIIENNTDDTLELHSPSPSLYWGRDYDEDVKHALDFDLFDVSPHPQSTWLIKPGRQLECTIRYQANYPDDPNDPEDPNDDYKVGTKKAQLELGPYIKRPEGDDTKIGMEDVVAYRKFKIYVRKTVNYIDMYPDTVRYDSVYINPKEIYYWPLHVVNTTTFTQPIELETREFNMLTPEPTAPEFHEDTLQVPLQLPHDSSVDWRLGYYPLNKGGDKCEVKFTYRPDKDNFPDSVFHISTYFEGFGVEQEYAFYSSPSATVTRDTVDFGDVWTGDTHSATFVMANYGNLPFGSLGSEIKLLDRDLPGIGFSIQEAPGADSIHIYPNETDNLVLNFQPPERGEYLERLVIHSDILQRGIFGVPDGTETIELYLKGRGVEPEIALPADTIDLGNVFIRPGCPNSRDTILPILNKGNHRLRIKSIYFENAPSEFEVNTSTMNIDPGLTSNISVTFSSNIVDQEFYDSLVFETNGNPPHDKVKLIFKATGIRPLLTNVTIPDNIRSRPGRIIFIPILTDQYITYARTFNAELSYDMTTLHFLGTDLSHTASEAAIVADAFEDKDRSRLSLNIELPSQSYFRQRDTLIKLKFICYLGETAFTTLSLEDPKFGDGLCDQVLSPDIHNGAFYLDSVCGLQLKTLHFNDIADGLITCSPNPGSGQIAISFETVAEKKVTIDLYNSFGKQVRAVLKNRKVARGRHEILTSVNDLPAGVYYCVFNAGLHTETLKIVVTN